MWVTMRAILVGLVLFIPVFITGCLNVLSTQEASPDWESEDLHRIAYHNPDITVDLGVGLWAIPLPMDFDDDGDLDLVVSCPDFPFNGIYFFENKAGLVE